jgi:PAS domain S-box-containing protein
MLDGAGMKGGAAGFGPTLPSTLPAPRGAPLLRRLIALVAAVALPLLGLATWGVWTAQAGIRRQAEEALLRRVEAVAMAVEREFDRAETLLVALAASASLARGDLADFEEEMRSASAAFGGAPITLIGGDMTLLLSTLWPSGLRRPGIPAPAEARRLIAEGRMQVTNLFVAPVGGALSVAVGLPLRLSGVPDPIRPAALGLSLPRETISALLRGAAGLTEADEARGWTASIFDRDGTSVARTGAEPGIVGQPASAETRLRLATLPDGLQHDGATRAGIPAVVALHRGRHSGYRYVLTMPRSEFRAPLRAELLRIAVAGGMVLAFGLALAALLARRTVAALRVAREAGLTRRTPPTGLREADELAQALAEAAAERGRVEAALTASEHRNREVLESLGDRLYALDRHGRLRFASRAALDGWGVTADSVLGRPVEQVFPQAVGSAGWEAMRAALATGSEAHLCAVSTILDCWVEIDAYPSADGGLTVAFRDVESLRRATRERARAMEALHASEQRLRMAMDAAALGAWELDLRAGLIRRSPRTLEIFGFPQEAEVERYPAWRGRIHPEDQAATVETIQAAITGRLEGYTAEYRFLRPDGRWIWVESHGRVVARDPATGAALRLAGTSRDISARRAAEQRQSLLAREVDHRAKNALAVVQAAVRLTPKDDAGAFARAIEGRVGALARAQTLLAADCWQAADLRTLLEGELAPFLAESGAGPHAELTGPPVALPAGMTQPLAMAVHELATNAVKHGALATPAGRVGVAWRVEAPASALGTPLLRLRWQESGGAALAGPPARRGFGSRVLEGTLRGQLGGEVTLAWTPAGLDCAIAVPLPSGATGDAATKGDAESG